MWNPLPSGSLKVGVEPEHLFRRLADFFHQHHRHHIKSDEQTLLEEASHGLN